jgi:hypothetical protein
MYASITPDETVGEPKGSDGPSAYASVLLLFPLAVLSFEILIV